MSTDTEKSDATPSAPELPKSTVNAITKFVAEHGGTASAVIQPVGLAGVRITLVGADGILGDQVVERLHQRVQLRFASWPVRASSPPAW